MKKVVIINDRGMGDCLISVMASNLILEHMNVAVTFVFPKNYIKLFNNRVFIQNYSASYVQANYRSLKGILKFIRTLLSTKPDIVIDLSRTRRIKKVMKLLNLFTFNKFPFKTYLGHDFNKEKYNALSLSQHDLTLALSELFQEGQVGQSTINVVPKLELSARPYIVVSLATSTKVHQVSPTLFVSLVKRLHFKFPEKEIHYLYSGSVLDVETMLLIKNELDFVRFRNEDLMGLPDVLNQSMMFLGLDTGIKHLSVYMGVPTFSFIPVKSYPFSHPYDLPHNGLRMGLTDESAKSELDKWLLDNFL